MLLRGTTDDLRGAVAATQRGRVMIATADVTAERGFAKTTVAQIVAAAGVSRRTFYEHFDDSTDALLATYDTATMAMQGALGQAIATAPDVTEARIGAAVETFLGLMADEPHSARVALVEILAVGAAGWERYTAAAAQFTAMLTASHAAARAADPAVVPASAIAIRALGGGINRIVTEEVLAGRAATLPELAPDITELAITTLAGRTR